MNYDVMKLNLCILVILFICSLSWTIYYTNKNKRRRKEVQKIINGDNLAKIYLNIINGKGKIQVNFVDGGAPLMSNEVIQPAFFLSCGRHDVTLSVLIKDNIYYTDHGVFNITFDITELREFNLCFDALTQNIFITDLKEKEEVI